MTARDDELLDRVREELRRLRELEQHTDRAGSRGTRESREELELELRDEALRILADRGTEQRRKGNSAPAILIQRVRAVSEARKHGSKHVEREALIDLASSAAGNALRLRRR